MLPFFGPTDWAELEAMKLSRIGEGNIRMSPTDWAELEAMKPSIHVGKEVFPESYGLSRIRGDETEE